MTTYDAAVRRLEEASGPESECVACYHDDCGTRRCRIHSAIAALERARGERDKMSAEEAEHYGHTKDWQTAEDAALVEEAAVEIEAIYAVVALPVDRQAAAVIPTLLRALAARMKA